MFGRKLVHEGSCLEGGGKDIRFYMKWEELFLGKSNVHEAQILI